MRIRKQVLDGIIETLVMGVLESDASYGYAIVRELNRRAGGAIICGEGTVYPVLRRLQEKGYVLARWSKSSAGRKRKYYRLSAKGRRQLKCNRDEWALLTDVMAAVAGIKNNIGWKKRRKTFGRPQRK
ncbi:MAG: PadR family transcriptional regulator [Planctomycetota bacterium]